MSNAIIIKAFIIFLMGWSASTREVYPEGLWPMTSFGEFSATNEQILGYYDFSRDRNVDILTCVQGTSTSELRIYIWNKELNTFNKRVSLDLGLFKPSVAIPGDVTQDGGVDLVLGLESSSEEPTTTIMIYSVNCSQTQCTISNIINRSPIASSTIPSVMQIQGRNVLVYTSNGQLMGESFTNGVSSTGNLVTNYFASSSSADIASVCADYLDLLYLDYNGDCILDLIIHCNPNAGMADIQFYKGNTKGLFSAHKKINVVEGMKLIQVTAADINFDGMIDIVQLLANANGDLQIETHYNTATKNTLILCSVTSASPDFPFHFVDTDTQLTQSTLKIQRQPLNINYKGWTIEKQIPSKFYLRPGDINNDGYLDLIVDGPGQAVLLINEQCSNSSCGTYNSKFMETWSLINIRMFSQREVNGMSSYNSQICQMSFFDLEEDGRLDIIANLCPPENTEETTAGNLLPIFNSLAIDAFFIKITILDNPKNETVSTETMDKKLNTYGAHADFFVTALNGATIPACGNQLSNPGRSLQLPYIHTGLGRTNNYVESVSIVISGSSDSYITKTWTPIVPNSQLIIVPGPKWVLETYISPTAIMAVLFWFVVLVLVLMALWIFRLTKLEKVEDKENEDNFYSFLR